MKTIALLSLSSITKSKRKTIIVLSILLMSVMLITIIASIWIALLDLQDNILFDEFSHNSHIPENEIQSRIISNGERRAIRAIGVIFTCIGILIAVISISNAVQINYGEKVKTLTILSMLGCKTRHKILLMLLDTVVLSFAGIPLGIFAGLSISNLMLNYLNISVCAVLNLPNITLLRGETAIFCVCLIIICILTAFVSALRPALKLLKTPLIELAKTNSEINISLKESFLDRFFENKFGINGKLAGANYENNKRKFRMISVSVSASCVLFVTLAMFQKYMTQQAHDQSDVNLVKSFMLFFYLFVIVAFVLILCSSVCMFTVNFCKRKPEFAVLLSNGIEERNLIGIVMIESIYYGIHMILYTSTGSLISDVCLFGILSSLSSRYHFVFPWLELIISAAIVLIATIFLSVFMVYTIRNINVVDELKRTF